MKGKKCVYYGFNWLRIGPVAGSFEHGVKLQVALKAGNFLARVSDYQFHKKGSAA
jgi:hypothetical protein